MAQQTRQIVSTLVRQGDTLERLALKFMDSADNWQQLAVLNGLDYPYISDNTGFARNLFAKGSVTFTRTNGSVGAVTIPAAYVVSVPATANAPLKVYTLDAQVVIPNGVTSASGTLTASTAGEAGNTPGLTVTALSTAISNLGSVLNAAAITGGDILNVKVPGDSLLVYTTSSGASGAAGVDTTSLQGSQAAFLAALLGTDAALGQDGDLIADSRGGVAVSKGQDNLVAALTRRFQTSLGWYSYYPSYGSGVEKAVGQRAEPYWLQWARLEAERTVRTDPRVQDVQGIQAAFKAGTLTLKFDIIIIGQQTAQNVVIALRPLATGV